MLKYFYIIFVVLLISIYLIQCNTKNFYETEISNSDLRNLLIKRSSGKGLDFFILPESHEFSKIPQDTSNPLSDVKIQLGKFLFFDPAISFNPKCTAASRTFSCASCHFSEAGFQAGIRQSIAGGGRGHGFMRTKHPLCDSSEVDVQLLRTPSIINCAYQEAQLWSGKLGCCGPNTGSDSLWKKGSFLELNGLKMQGVETQARVGLEAHGFRMSPELITNTIYGTLFDSAFKGSRPDLIYRRFTMAKAIAAYERTVLSNQAPFQKWLRGDSTALSATQLFGAYLFFDKAKCDNCHTGPALNSMSFHALGFNDMTGIDIIDKNDAPKDVTLGRGGYTNLEEDKFKFKVPQLYNLKNIEFLGHGGNFCSVEEIVRYKNEAKSQNPNVTEKYLSQDFKPLHLNNKEIKALVDFIENALYDPNLKRYEPKSVPSGFCFPNADIVSKKQLHCE
ncbi:MAG: cytochrome-c peroxidase [Saprospiraceae bacterium]|nr:cytochrome-c peroxidase [Saprospiraceae bacterium]